MGEVGYIPFDGEAANLVFRLVSARYERASVIVTSNRPSIALVRGLRRRHGRRAIIYQLVHHAEVVTLKATATD